MKIRMKTATTAALAALALTLSASAGQPPEVPESLRYARQLGEVYKRAADAVSPAVVHIATSRQGRGFGSDLFGRFFDLSGNTVALGSGVIVRSDGYIITNNHVVHRAGKLTVKLRDGRQFEAKVVGADPPTDLAVVKIAGTGLPAAEFGNSDETAAGHLVLAIGNPYGLDRTVTQGIISAIGRANVGIADYEDFIQTDAAINPGNSGGPLIDIEGKVIGINTAILTRTGGFQGIGLAIPSNMVTKVMNELIERGHVTRGYLGVTIQNISPELAAALTLKSNQGVVVTDVIKGAPAEKAGLAKGDVITEYEGRAVTNVRQLRSMVATTPVGKEVQMAIVRDGKPMTLAVSIGELAGKEISPPASTDSKSISRLGIEVRDITDSVRQQFNITARKGVLIAGVVPDGPADKAGIRPGAVILEANHIEVSEVAEFEEALDKIPRDKNVLLLLQDRVMKYYVVVRPEK